MSRAKVRWFHCCGCLGALLFLLFLTPGVQETIALNLEQSEAARGISLKATPLQLSAISYPATPSLSARGFGRTNAA